MSESNNKMGKGVYQQMREDEFLQGPISINRPISWDPSDLDLNKPNIREIKNAMVNKYLIDEVGQWDSSLLKKAQLNQSSLPSEYPSINNMFKEYPLSPKECFKEKLDE